MKSKFKKRYTGIPIIDLMMRKRIYLVNPRFQLKFMGIMMLMVLIALAIFYGANHYFFQGFIAKGEMLNLPPDHAFFLLIEEQQAVMDRIFIVASVVVFFTIGVWGLFFSHRIAGPLFRLNRCFKKAAEEKQIRLEEVHFRKNDFFQELPSSINQYFDSLEQDEENKKKAS